MVAANGLGVEVQQDGRDQDVGAWGQRAQVGQEPGDDRDDAVGGQADRLAAFAVANRSGARSWSHGADSGTAPKRSISGSGTLVRREGGRSRSVPSWSTSRSDSGQGGEGGIQGGNGEAFERCLPV